MIFYHDAEQGRMTRRSKETIEASGKFRFGKIMTTIMPAPEVYRAEEYHRHYNKKQRGKRGCGIEEPFFYFWLFPMLK